MPLRKWFATLREELPESATPSRKAEHLQINIERDVAAKILGWCLATIRYEATNGWIEGGSDTREWVEHQLHWSEFLAASQAERR